MLVYMMYGDIIGVLMQSIKHLTFCFFKKRLLKVTDHDFKARSLIVDMSVGDDPTFLHLLKGNSRLFHKKTPLVDQANGIT